MPRGTGVFGSESIDDLPFSATRGYATGVDQITRALMRSDRAAYAADNWHQQATSWQEHTPGATAKSMVMCVDEARRLRMVGG
jgi:hypothetical protein